jgi:hypothetical protein
MITEMETGSVISDRIVGYPNKVLCFWERGFLEATE